MTEDWLRATASHATRAGVDPSVPNVARVWNYLVGGRENFEADRRAARQLISEAPGVANVGVASRAFLRRTVSYLVEAGIRQFLDIGAGIPTAGSTHEIAKEIAPSSRIVYVDNDPVALAYGRAVLRSASEGGAINYVEADAHDLSALT